VDIPQAERSLIVTHQPSSVVVLGAGYAGLFFTTRLAGKVSARDARITLVSDSPSFVERPRLHQFAADEAVAWRAIPDVLRGTDVQFVQGRVTHIIPESKQVEIQDEQQVSHSLPYDYLVYALGSVTERERVPGVSAYTYTLAPSGPLSAATLREALPALAARAGRVIVCGGGATGIETAAEFASTYPRLKVQLVTQGAFGIFLGEGVAAYMWRSLERLGVTITDQTTIAEVRADGVRTSDGREYPCDVCVWAGGFTAPSLAGDTGLAVNERDQVVVDPYLRSLSHPDIFAIGDAAHPQVDPGVPVRMSAFTAAIMGAHGADVLSAMLRGRAPRPLSFAYFGQGIALGRGNAIGFNNYPDDRPHRPYFTGWLGYQVRECFVRYLGSSPRRELRLPGSFIWVGKGRYAATQRRLMATKPKDLARLHQA
jgi:NADH dehydrogenase FAD-containing subunit